MFPSVLPADGHQHAAGSRWKLDMMEAREGGLSRPGEADERHHKDRVMERDTERGGEGRESPSIIHHAVLGLWEGVMRADEGIEAKLGHGAEN